MICANLWLFTMAGGLGVLAFLNRISPIAILSTVFLAGVGFAVNGPSWTASIPEIVDDDELASAVILGGIQLNISGLVGSAVGGVLTHLFGPGVVFMINALGFLLVVAAVVAWKAGSSERVVRRTEISRAGPTMSDLNKIPSAVKAVWVRSVLFSIPVAAEPALIPILCLKEICVDSSRLGFTLASVAFGSIAGAVWVLPSLRRRFSSDDILRIAFSILALSFLGLAFIPVAPVFLLLCTFSGAAWSIAGSELWVIAQRAATNSIRGRANAILLMVSQGALALGATVLGAIAAHAGTSTAFSLAAIFLLILACLPNAFGLTFSTEPPPTYNAMH
jgi:predicted MFS family arabinose efflux permease